MRAATLHNQDLALQNATQEQQDAHESHMKAMHANDQDWGIDYDTIANQGDAVFDHLKTQTAANGSAVVPPGTHLSPDGESILIPKDTPETQAGQLEQFKAVAPALGLNVSIPNGATKLDPKVATVFYNKLQGFDPNGDIYGAEKLPGLIASNQAQRDALAKKGAPQVQLDALDGIITKQQAQLKADNDAQTTAANAASQRKINETNAINNNKSSNQIDVNAAKPQKADTNLYIGTDASGNQVAGTTDQMKGLSGVIKADSDTGKKIVAAREMISPDGLFNTISQQVKSLAASGKLRGAGQARLNDVMLNKVGSNPDYAPLADNLSLLSTKLMLVHVGNKGSNEMMDHFKALADAGKMDLPTLIGGLKTEYQYVQGMARMPKTQPQQPNGGQ